MPDVTEVEITAADPQRFSSVLDEEQMVSLRSSIEHARTVFEGHSIWNVNSTAHGGGVAEMLNTLLPYARGAGVDARWMVIGGDDEFFRITKRIHNRLHGASGDGEGLGDDDRRHYEEVLAQQGEQLKERMRPRRRGHPPRPPDRGTGPGHHGCRHQGDLALSRRHRHAQ